MERFWAMAAAHWPLSTPRASLEDLIGVAQVDALLGVGILHVAALEDGDVVECASCGANARLVWEDAGFVAVCEGEVECPCEPFGSAPERVFIDPGAFARTVADALGLEGVPGVPAPVVPLGRRMFGEERVAFDLVARPGRAGLLDALERHARGGPRVRVVLVPDSRRLPASAPTELAGVEIVWVGLDELLVVGTPLRVDLRAIVSRRHFPGVIVEERFDGLLVGDRRASWRGQAFDIEASPLSLRLLRLLATQPGEFVGDAALWRSLYPDDHTKGGNLARGANPEDLKDRVRFVVGSLRAALRGAGAGELVENVRGGGYRLALPLERVRIAS